MRVTHAWACHQTRSATTRAQRASARNFGANAPASDPLAPLETTASSSQMVSDSDPLSMALDSDENAMSRSNSLPNADDPTVASSHMRTSHISRKDKGKGREKDAAVRVKEEPSAVTLAMNDTVPALVSSLRSRPFEEKSQLKTTQTNEDHCSACRSLGALVYCDGCTRAFHLWCLDPPMEQADIPQGEERWFCPACTIHRVRATLADRLSQLTQRFVDTALQARCFSQIHDSPY